MCRKNCRSLIKFSKLFFLSFWKRIVLELSSLSRIVIIYTSVNIALSEFELVMMNKLNNPRLSTNRSVILHFYSLRYRCATETARHTKILVRPVRYNMVKIRQQGNVERRGGNGQPHKISVNINLLTGQWIRGNREITVK